MKFWAISLVLSMGCIAAEAIAQVPADAPAGSTGLCKDGSYTSNATKKGACAGHKGVKTWYTAVAAPAPASATTAPAAKSTANATKPTAAPAPAPGDVWVNTSTKVYHCPGSKWYGKTKQGSYMSESAAKAAGDHADHGKACS